MRFSLPPPFEIQTFYAKDQGSPSISDGVASYQTMEGESLLWDKETIQPQCYLPTVLCYKSDEKSYFVPCIDTEKNKLTILFNVQSFYFEYDEIKNIISFKAVVLEKEQNVLKEYLGMFRLISRDGKPAIVPFLIGAGNLSAASSSCDNDCAAMDTCNKNDCGEYDGCNTNDCGEDDGGGGGESSSSSRGGGGGSESSESGGESSGSSEGSESSGSGSSEGSESSGSGGSEGSDSSDRQCAMLDKGETCTFIDCGHGCSFFDAPTCENNDCPPSSSSDCGDCDCNNPPGHGKDETPGGGGGENKDPHIPCGTCDCKERATI